MYTNIHTHTMYAYHTHNDVLYTSYHLDRQVGEQASRPAVGRATGQSAASPR